MATATAALAASFASHQTHLRQISGSTIVTRQLLLPWPNTQPWAEDITPRSSFTFTIWHSINLMIETEC